MLFSNKRRVEEDLERIRRANLSPERQAGEERQKTLQDKVVADNLEKLTAKDFWAMIIAVFSILLPYVAVFAGLLAAVWIAVQLLAR